MQRAKPSTTRRAPEPERAAHEATTPTARVLRQFRVVFNSVRSHFQRIERRIGVGGAQLWAMSVIRERPRIGMNDLARAMDIHQSTASNLVKGLVERGLVEVARSGIDRRAVHLALRPAGSRLLRRAPGPLAGVLPDALAALDAKALGRLERDLSLLIEALGAGKHAEHTPLAQM